MSSVADKLFRVSKSTFDHSCLFSKGWGPSEIIREALRLSVLEQSGGTSHHNLMIQDISIEYSPLKEKKKMLEWKGSFKSPVAHMMPEKSQRSHFKLVVPTNPTSSTAPLFIHFPPTGDQGYGLRSFFFAEPLAEKGVASLMIENPFYGLRKPDEQTASNLLHVSDLMVIGVALVSESLSLIKHFRQQSEQVQGGRGEEREPSRLVFGPFGLTGVSMGAHMASLAGVISREPVALVPCLSPSCAGPVFTRGVLQDWCDWKILQDELPSLKAALGDTPLSSKSFDDARDLMSDVLGFVTDICRFRPPTLPSAAIQVASKIDGYVPETGSRLHAHWKGSELRWTDEGHILSYVLQSGLFRDAMLDSLDILSNHLLLNRPSSP